MNTNIVRILAFIVGVFLGALKCLKNNIDVIIYHMCTIRISQWQRFDLNRSGFYYFPKTTIIVNITDWRIMLLTSISCEIRNYIWITFYQQNHASKCIPNEFSRHAKLRDTHFMYIISNNNEWRALPCSIILYENSTIKRIYAWLICQNLQNGRHSTLNYARA